MKQSRPRVPGWKLDRPKPKPYGSEREVERAGREFDTVAGRPGTYWRRRLPGAE